MFIKTSVEATSVVVEAFSVRRAGLGGEAGPQGADFSDWGATAGLVDGGDDGV